MSDLTVLFVDDEAALRLAASQALDLADLPAQTFDDGEKALATIARNAPSILVTDIRMPKMDGLTLMAKALEIDPEYPVILVTGHGDVELAVRSMREGAYDFIEKPYAPSRLVETVRRALDKRRLTLENRSLRSEVAGRDVVEARLVGRSPIMVALRRTIRAIAETEADALIVGATGTGKEVAARAIHRISSRQKHPFVAINCAALPQNLIESELFGHEAGAFPGAARARFGKFEHARGGTVFLDEIDSMPEPLQAKLLHVIQNRAVTRLGSHETIPLDVRFLAASKQDLEAEAAAGRFRADLLYRLNVVTLRLPPLSERTEDIPRLFQHLLNETAARYKRPVPPVGPQILSQLATQNWPGNVRELRNVAERYVLGLEDGPNPAPLGTATNSLSEQMAAHEKSLLTSALTAHGGSLKETYEALNLSRKSLYEKMQRYGLKREDFVALK